MSIKKKITILFILSLFVMLFLSFWLNLINQEKNTQLTLSKYINTSKELLPLIFNENKRALQKKSEEFNYQNYKNVKGINIFHKNLGVGVIDIIKNSQGLFLKINYLDDEYIFFDTTQKLFKQEALITNLFFIFDIILLIIIYFFTLRIIAPIKSLSNSVKEFAKGDFDITIPSKGNDELALLAKSFNEMAKELKESFQDRENLLRYFGHEIRTPLAKARYALEAKNLEELDKNLQDIQKFVENVLNMHLITSKNLQKENFLASTLIVEALNKSKIKDEKSISINLKEDFTIYGDLHYLSIALKNLLDNAFTYATKLPITILIEKNTITISNYGLKLQEGFKYYLQPFVKKSKDGLGLGLSLTNFIIIAHNFELLYKFHQGQNLFTIKFIHDSF